MELTYLEYLDVCDTIVDEDKFNSLLTVAKRHINIYTRRFYDTYNFADDYEWRKKAVREALALQVEYLHQSNATTFEGINSAPQSVTLGRTSISHASRFNASGSNEKKSLVCMDAQLALHGTGLLNRGVGYG